MRYLEHRGEAGKVAQTYEVTFELEPPSDLNLLPGMTAIIHLERHSARDTAQTVEIPSSALATNPDNVLGVWVLSETTGKVHWQGVTAEASAAGKFRILQGLRGNELIVTTGVALLRNNMHIIALPDEPQGASD